MEESTPDGWSQEVHWNVEWANQGLRAVTWLALSSQCCFTLLAAVTQIQKKKKKKLSLTYLIGVLPTQWNEKGSSGLTVTPQTPLHSNQTPLVLLHYSRPGSCFSSTLSNLSLAVRLPHFWLFLVFHMHNLCELAQHSEIEFWCWWKVSGSCNQYWEPRGHYGNQAAIKGAVLANSWLLSKSPPSLWLPPPFFFNIQVILMIRIFHDLIKCQHFI